MSRSGDARSGVRPWWAFWRRRRSEPSPDLPPPAPPDSIAAPPADVSPLPAPFTAPPAALSPEHERWRQWARAILADDDAWMIVDVETTGLGAAADITEIAAVTPRGTLLFESLIRPPRRIPAHIVQLTGITDAMVAGAPAFADVYARLIRAHLAQRGILAYGASFDVRMLRLSIARHCRLTWQPTRSDDVMRAYAAYHAALHPGDGRRAPKLTEACRQMGITHDDAHRALADCLATARLIQAMAR